MTTILHTPTDPSPTDPSPTDPASSSEERAREVMDDIAERGRIPGLSVAVATPDRVLHAGAVGYADLQTGRVMTIDDQYPWFSLTKIATATTAMRLSAEGVLDLDAPIGTYLPRYRGHATYGHPTTRDLLSHTAGLGNPLPVRWVRPADQPPDPTVLAHLLSTHGTIKRPVGATASYSNIGYLLAGEVIARAAGATVEACVRGCVLDPLTMESTGYGYRTESPRAVGYVRLPRVANPLLRALLPSGIVGPRVHGYTSLRPFLVNGSAYGGLVGTALDAVRLAAVHAAGAADPHPVLSHSHVESMRTITATGKRFDHGLGWFRRPTDATAAPAFVEHYGTGGGFWNAMRIYPGQRLALVAMANTTSAWDFDGLFDRLKDLPWT